MWHFCLLYMSLLYILLYRTLMFYTTISLFIIILCAYVFICGGHHDSDRIGVLLIASKAESIVLYKSSCIMYNYLNKDCIH